MPKPEHPPIPRPHALRAGFTLTELLIVSALFSIIMAEVAIILPTAHRLYVATIADIELTLHSHALREKLLFNLTPEEGGLMNATLADIDVEDKHPNGKGKGLKYKPVKGQMNRLTLGTNKKLKMDRGNENWLRMGKITFGTEELFFVGSSANGTVTLDLDLALQVLGRQYRQQNLALVQIANE